MRSLVVGMALACLMTTSVEAGLQNALTTSLLGLQVANPLYPVATIPEGALFIDPIASTRGNGIYRAGPTFEYHPTTGGVTVFAPPMLGPADEFGSRRQLSPVSVDIVGGGFLADAPSIPQVTMYRRNIANSYDFYWQPPQIDDDDPSFVIDEQNVPFNLAVLRSSITLSTYDNSGLFGVEVDFPILLAADLNSEVFEADEEALLPNSVWPHYLPSIRSTLPDVHFVINYQASYYGGLYLNPSQYSLLAVPQTGLIGFNESAIPEPNSMMLAFLALIAQVVTRRGK
jgi:hypothetical protein